jgi:hypothetical protein
MRFNNRGVLQVVLIILAIFIPLIYLLDRPVNPTEELVANPTSVAFTPTSPPTGATVAAERTAIAIFTQNPTLALSSTPFYAEIIFNDVIRNLTEIPLPRRAYYIDPASLTVTPTPGRGCLSVVSTWTDPESGQLLEDAIKPMVDIPVSVGVVSNGVSSCQFSRIAIESQIPVFVQLEANANSRHSIIETILNVIVTHKNQLPTLSRNPAISIAFPNPDPTIAVITNFDAAYDALNRGLHNEDLIEALGGYVELPSS